MKPAPEFGEVLQRQRLEYSTGMLSLQAAGLCVLRKWGALDLGIRDRKRGVRLCFEATEAGLRAEVVGG